MKKFFKQLGIGALSLAMVVGAGFSLTACGKKEDKNQVLSLSVNPGVEFVVDKEDKVVSVTASNEDGAYILNKFTEFTGMSAKDAALKFLELSEEYGFVVEGSTDGEEFTISVSGEGAEDLYNDVKNKIQTKATELGLAINEMVEITKTELEALVSECYQEYAQADIENMTEEQLVEMLKQSRIETKDLLTEDERLEYYRDRVKTIISTKIEQIQEFITENVPAQIKLLVQANVTILEGINSFIDQQYQAVNTLLSEEYAAAEAELENYIAKKEAYLAKVEEYRTALELNADADATNDVENVEELKQQFESLKTQAKGIYEGLEEERDAIKAEVMNFVKTQLETKIKLLNDTIDAIAEYVELNMSNIQTEVNAKLTELKNTYSSSAENPWEE